MPAIDFRALFELSPNPYMLLGRQLRFVAANRAYLDVSGRPLEDLLGRNSFFDPPAPEEPGPLRSSNSELETGYRLIVSRL